jgi:hypothetical protein
MKCGPPFPITRNARRGPPVTYRGLKAAQRCQTGRNSLLQTVADRNRPTRFTNAELIEGSHRLLALKGEAHLASGHVGITIGVSHRPHCARVAGLVGGGATLGGSDTDGRSAISAARADATLDVNARLAARDRCVGRSVGPLHHDIDASAFSDGAFDCVLSGSVDYFFAEVSDLANTCWELRWVWLAETPDGGGAATGHVGSSRECDLVMGAPLADRISLGAACQSCGYSEGQGPEARMFHDSKNLPGTVGM